MTNVPNISTQLCEFVSKTRYEDIPTHVIHEAKRSLLNYFAVCLAAVRDDTVGKALELCLSLSSDRQAVVIGRGVKTDILNAAALNCMAANVFDFDDTHIPTIIHPSAPVAAALFALAAHQKMSGKEFLLSFVLGVDLECRIGRSISPGHYSKGWHITSTCGVFGSGAACGKAIGLSEKQLIWMLGNASAQACGLVETLGTMAKSLSVANAAKNGLLSALLAKNNFNGPQFPLEGERGFLKVFSDRVDFNILTQGLAAQWELLNNTYKPYPCGVVLNPVIEACLCIFNEIQSKKLDLQEVQTIELRGHPLLKQRTDRPHISTGRESQVSAQHAVGIVLSKGQAGLHEFSDSAQGDTFAKWLGSKVHFVDDSQMQVEGAQVCLRFKDQSEIRMRVENAKGSLKNPLTDKDLENKLITLFSTNFERPNNHNPEKLIQQIWSFESLDNVTELLF